jgi:hypothetical protein
LVECKVAKARSRKEEMGYDLHITRASQWSDSANSPVLLQEWLAYVEIDPALQLTNNATVRSPDGHVISYDSEGLAVWTGFSGHEPEGNRKVWFDYRNGRIVVKNPNDEIIQKMKSIAVKLNSRVVGDEGESY